MKTLLKIAAALVALVLIAIVALPFLIDANRFRPLLEQQLSQALGRQVTIGNLSLALLQGGVSANDLSISDDPDFAKQPFLTAKSLNVAVDLKALILSRALHVQGVTIEGAEVALIQQENGAWNFSSLGAAKSEPAPVATPTPAPTAAEAPLDLSVKLVRIQNAHVALMQRDQKRDFKDVNFELRDFSTTAALPFSLSAGVGGGTVALTGTAGPIAKADTAETPFDTQIEIKALDLAAANFTREESGLAGVLSFTGSVNSNGTTAAVKGAATIDRLRLSRPGGIATRPVAANIALVHNLKTRTGNIARSTIKLGSASAEISGSYNLTTVSPTINVALAGPGMPLQELLSFLPVFDIVLPSGATIEGGTLTLGIASRGTLEHLNSTGSVKIEKAKLAGYDLGSKLKIIQQLAGMPTTPVTDIEVAGSAFENGPFGTRLKNIQFAAPSIGKLTGEGTVSPMHELDFKMSAVVKTGGLLAAALQQRGETTTVPFFILGTSANPIFKADVKALANEKLQQIVNNPEGAVKNAKDIANTARGIINMFKKAPPKAEAK
ncbi:MAG: AsmA family protein [Bryobacteraceae bacterium]